MFDKERYKQEVFERKLKIDNLQKIRNPIKLIPTIAMIGIMTIGVTAVAVVGDKVYKNSIEQTAVERTYDKEFNRSDKMEIYEEEGVTQGIYYKKIESYEQYLEYNNYWSNLIKVTEEEFKDNFVLIISLNSSGTKGIEIVDISYENNKISLTFEKEKLEGKEDSNEAYSVKIPREFLESELKINLVPGSSEMKEFGYTLMEDIDEEYVREQAIEEDCVIIDHWYLASDNKDKIYKFEEDYKNNKNAGIRFVKFGDFLDGTKFVIIDVLYYDGKSYVNIYNYGSEECEIAFVEKDGGISVQETDEGIDLTVWDTTYGLPIVARKSK